MRGLEDLWRLVTADRAAVLETVQQLSPELRLADALAAEDYPVPATDHWPDTAFW
jgi:hypothetical protein